VTLVELMVALGILTIVLTIGVPNFISLAHNSQVSALADALSMTLAVARSEAIRRGAPVTVCASTDGSTCGDDWSRGWIVTAPGAGDALRVHEGESGRLGPMEAADETRVVFGSLGALQSNPVAFAVGDRGLVGGRVLFVKVGASGRIAVTTDD
jgi:type IV fimbrial biogenesis protein FimT